MSEKAPKGLPPGADPATSPRRLAERIVATAAPDGDPPESSFDIATRSVWRSRFFWKLYYGYVALILATTAAVGLIGAYQVENNERAQLESSLAQRAQTILMLLHDAGHAVEGALAQLAEASTVDFAVFDGEGTVLLSTVEDAPVGSHEPVASLRRGAADDDRLHTTTAPDGARRLWVVVENTGGRGSARQEPTFVRVEMSAEVLATQLADLRWSVLVASIVAAIGALLLGFLHARQISRPLASMTAVAESMSAGDYDQRLAVRDEDEFGTLAQALNRLAASCRERMQTIITDRNKVVAILGSMVEGVVAIDAQERILHINRAARRLLGVGVRVEGRSVWEVTEVREAAEILTSCLRTASERVGELQLERAPRNQFVELHGAPLLAEDGSPVGSVLVLYEVTELRHLESVRQDFVANVSHELKTPIAAIRGLVETIIDDPEMTSDYRERFLGRIRDQADRLTTLVTELLTLARLESAEGVLETSLMDFRETVRQSLDSHRNSAEEKGLSTSESITREFARIEGEPEALRVVVDNLLDNAVKYTQHGGHVHVELEIVGDEVVLKVRDDGIGIDPDHLDRIFERFYRVDKARSRELGGTGLGLSIVKHIARAHAGRVWVESKPGRGSTFYLAIPYAAA